MPAGTFVLKRSPDALGVNASFTNSISASGLTNAIAQSTSHNAIFLRQRFSVGELVYVTNSEVTNNDLENVFVKVTQEAASQVSTLFASLFAARVEKLPSDDGSLVLPSPFLESELFDIEYDQSGDIITLTHPNHRPQELRRYDATDYQIVDIALEPPLPAPTGLNAATIDRGRVYAGTGVNTSSTPDRLQVGVGEEGTPFAIGDTVFLETSGQLPNTYYEVSSVDVVGSGAQGVNEIAFRDPLSGTSVILNGTNLGTASDARVYYSILTADPDETYVVTAIDERNQESFASEELLVTNQVLSVPGAKTTLQWTPVLGAVRYNVYKKLNGVFGFIGESAASGGPVEAFVDDGIGPSGDQTLLIQDTQIDESYQPRASARFEQRRCFGGSDNLPRTLFMSRSGTESSFSYRIPTLDSDRVSVDLASREAHVIRHIVPIQDLLMMTQQGSSASPPSTAMRSALTRLLSASSQLSEATMSTRSGQRTLLCFVRPEAVTLEKLVSEPKAKAT